MHDNETINIQIASELNFFLINFIINNVKSSINNQQ